tara:strand:+ start:2086 stop:3162 length:1077 start_codon:yes stop_codon:yes gene_type:complete
MGDLESHIHGMYDHFESKYGFKKPPTMFLNSEPDNQSKVLGKTAYYDPQSLEIHVFVDGRHPKDILRSIAHELIHHRQNLEGRLDTSGYSGPGYYLENDELKEVEHEAMLEGNATMREYEDTVKYKEKDKMSLKEWKNNELNKQLLKRFGILKEEKEITHMCALKVTHKRSGQVGHPIKHTLSESGHISHYTVEFKNVIVENIAVENLDIIQQEEHSHKRDDDKDHDENKPVVKEEELAEEAKPDFPDVDGDGDREEPISKAQKDKKEKGGNEKKASKPKKGEIPPQLRKHVKGKSDKKDDDKEEMDESTSGRHSDADRRQSKDREYADRLRESKTLQEAIKKIAKAKRVFLGNKRIK